MGDYHHDAIVCRWLGTFVDIAVLLETCFGIAYSSSQPKAVALPPP
jgi:hypothetical protein